MILNHLELAYQIKQINAELSFPAFMQKISSTAKLICVQVRSKGATHYLYLGRGAGTEGVFWDKHSPEAFLRKKDIFLEYLRRYLSGGILIELKLDEADRILQLSYQKAGQKNSFYIFWCARKTYFAHHFYDLEKEQWQLFYSWSGQTIASRQSDFSVFDEVGRKQLSGNHDSVLKINLEKMIVVNMLNTELKEARSSATQKKVLKALEKRCEKIQLDLLELAKWQDIQQSAKQLSGEDLQKLDSIVLHGRKFKFSRAMGAWDKIDHIHQTAKRLKAALPLQEKRLNETQEELLRLKRGEVSVNNLVPSAPVWSKGKQDNIQQTVKSTSDKYTIIQHASSQIGVGLSAQGNDELRKLWAKSDDWWIHASHGTSAHAIVRTVGSIPPDFATVTAAAELIAKRSGITSMDLEVIITQVKNVKGVTGSPGMVTYKKEKRLLCQLQRKEE